MLFFFRLLALALAASSAVNGALQHARDTHTEMTSTLDPPDARQARREFVSVSSGLNFAGGRHALAGNLHPSHHHDKKGKGGKKKPVVCKPYIRSNFTRKPVELQAWWNKQKQKDAAQGGLLRPLNAPRPYEGALKPYIAPAPRFNAYACCLLSDGNTSTAALPPVNQLKAINGLIFSFLTSNDTQFKLQAFTNASVAERRRALQSYHRAGVSVWASTFGGDPNEVPITKHYDPEALGYLHGEIAYGLGFDGIDVDLEDFPAFNMPDHSVVGWTVDYIKAVRKWLPAKEGFGLTAAPVAPWFTTSKKTYCHGAFHAINKQIGHEIDYYNTQFYNQGVGSYDTCNTILNKNKLTDFPETSLFQIARNGVPLNKLVIGKPGWPIDAANGWVAPEILSVCAKEASLKGWKGGFSSWQFGHANSQWFRETALWAFHSREL